MLRRVAPAWAVFVALPAIVLASCHLVGGNDELFIDPTFHTQGAGGSAAGTGGTTTTTTTTGTGGEGGERQTAACTIAADCPGMPTDCIDIACLNSECSAVNITTGEPCAEDAGNYCDGAGSCVECIDSIHCPPMGVCQSNACYVASCNNNTLDTNETDVDCGNACGPCDDGRNCDFDNDCTSLLCDEGTCIPCTDLKTCAADQFCDLEGDCNLKRGFGNFCLAHDWCASGSCCFGLCC